MPKSLLEGRRWDEFNRGWGQRRGELRFGVANPVRGLLAYDFGPRGGLVGSGRAGPGGALSSLFCRLRPVSLDIVIIHKQLFDFNFSIGEISFGLRELTVYMTHPDALSNKSVLIVQITSSVLASDRANVPLGVSFHDHNLLPVSQSLPYLPLAPIPGDAAIDAASGAAGLQVLAFGFGFHDTRLRVFEFLKGSFERG